MTYTVSSGTLNSTIPYHTLGDMIQNYMGRGSLPFRLGVIDGLTDMAVFYIYIYTVQKKSEPRKDFATTCVNLHQIKYTFTHTQSHVFQCSEVSGK